MADRSPEVKRAEVPDVADEVERSVFWDDHERDMADPEFRAEALRVSYELKVVEFARETRKVEAVLSLVQQRGIRGPMVGMEGIGWDAAMEAVERAIRQIEAEPATEQFDDPSGGDRG